MMWESGASYSGKHKIILFDGHKTNLGGLRKDSGGKGMNVGGPSHFGGPITLSWYLLGDIVFVPSA